jgi:hypothetical protein
MFLGGIGLTYFAITQMFKGFASVKGKKNIPGLVLEQDDSRKDEPAKFPKYGPSILISRANEAKIRRLEMSPAIKDYVDQRLKTVTRERRAFLQHYFDNRTKKLRAGAVIETAWVDKTMVVTLSREV